MTRASEEVAMATQSCTMSGVLKLIAIALDPNTRDPISYLKCAAQYARTGEPGIVAEAQAKIDNAFDLLNASVWRQLRIK